jgi:[protein-PII] uridylyltransferase
MAARFETLPNRRMIIDRRAAADQIAELIPGSSDATALRRGATQILKRALDHGRAEIARRLETSPTRGSEAAAAYAFLTDQILRLIYDFTVQRLYPTNNPTSGRAADTARGRRLWPGRDGALFGRRHHLPHPWKQTSWAEQVIESMLYTLWDLGLKIGHSSRSLDEMVRMAKSDLTIRTALLESRYVWGDEALHDEAVRRFERDVMAGTARTFVAEKLEERNERHKRMGDSRYVVEPNLKEGKGGLRDLHTLFWIGKYAYQVRSVPELVDKGLLTKEELRQFQKTENFLWAVRCHLHLITNRAEERLTFDVQRDIARRMRYADRPGRSAVERFMQHYFLTAKQVGDLTAVFLAHLDETFAARGMRFGLPMLRRKPKKLEGFLLERGG